MVVEERGRVDIDRDLVDGGLKLHTPSKIMFDIDACAPDNKFKNCTIL